MKNKPIRVYDNEGRVSSGWKFRADEWTSVGCYDERGFKKKPKRERGWVLTDCDGLERYCAGNYQDFIPFANMVLENYGMATRIS